MRPADRSVDRRHFGPPTWTGNRTAMPRRTDSDHAECNQYSFSYECWNFCANWLIWLEVIKENTRGWFFLNTCTTTPTILQPLYRTACTSWHPRLRGGGFCWSKVLLSACPCWWQLVHSDYGSDARVLHNYVTCTVSVPEMFFFRDTIQSGRSAKRRPVKQKSEVLVFIPQMCLLLATRRMKSTMLCTMMMMITTPSMRTSAHYDDVFHFRSVPKLRHRNEYVN